MKRAQTTCLKGRTYQLSGMRTSAVISALVVVFPAWGLDLRQSYEAAVKNDATIRASRATAEATRERLPQARAQRLPNVSLNVTRNYNDLETKTHNFYGQPTTLQNQYYSGNQNLTVRQPLYRPFVHALVQQAEAQIDDANASLERDEQGLVVRVSEAYFDALLARSQLELVVAQKVSYAAQLDAAKKSLIAGSGTRTDVDDAQAHVDMVLAQELEARQNLEFTQRRIEVLIGQPTGILSDLDVTRFQPALPVPSDVQQWITLAEDASPELQSMKAQVEAARLEIDKAQSGHKPTLDAVAQWARSSSDSVSSVNTRYDQRYVGLQLSMPLYSGGQVNSAVRQAVAGHERAREVLEATRLDLGVRVHREFRAVSEGVLRIAALEQAVRSTELAVQSNRKSFEAGSRTTLDVFNAEQQKTAALRDLAQARYVYLVSRMRLQSLAGQDRWENVEQTNRILAVGNSR